MTIIECASMREVPDYELWAPQVLTKDYTVDNAIADYVRHFGVQPTKGWQWGNYLYIEKPEGK